MSDESIQTVALEPDKRTRLQHLDKYDAITQLSQSGPRNLYIQILKCSIHSTKRIARSCADLRRCPSALSQ